MGYRERSCGDSQPAGRAVLLRLRLSPGWWGPKAMSNLLHFVQDPETQEEPSLKLWNLGVWHQMTTCSYLIAWFFSNLCLHSNWLIGVPDSIWGQERLQVYFFVTLYFFVADKVWKYLNLCSLLSGLTFKKEKKQSDWLYILLAVYLSVKYCQSAHVKLDWCCYVFHFHMCSNDSMVICFSKRNISAYIADFLKKYCFILVIFT